MGSEDHIKNSRVPYHLTQCSPLTQFITHDIERLTHRCTTIIGVGT